MPTTEVEVRLTPSGSGSVFELEHTGTVDPAMWSQFGPGAVGVGWDGAVLGLAIHLSGESWEKPDDWEKSPEAVEFMTRSAEAWGVAHEKSGATAAEAATGVQNTIAAYVGSH